MKRYHLGEEERRTLFEMGMWHSHPRVRRHAQALVRLFTAPSPDIHLVNRHHLKASGRLRCGSGIKFVGGV